MTASVGWYGISLGTLLAEFDFFPCQFFHYVSINHGVTCGTVTQENKYFVLKLIRYCGICPCMTQTWPSGILETVVKSTTMSKGFKKNKTRLLHCVLGFDQNIVLDVWVQWVIEGTLTTLFFIHFSFWKLVILLTSNCRIENTLVGGLPITQSFPNVPEKWTKALKNTLDDLKHAQHWCLRNIW